MVSYSVGQRTHEFGVRMALAAQRRSVCQLVLRQAASLIVVGTVLGIVCAIAAAMVLMVPALLASHRRAVPRT